MTTDPFKISFALAAPVPFEYLSTVRGCSGCFSGSGAETEAAPSERLSPAIGVVDKPDFVAASTIFFCLAIQKRSLGRIKGLYFEIPSSEIPNLSFRSASSSIFTRLSKSAWYVCPAFSSPSKRVMRAYDIIARKTRVFADFF